MRVARLVLVHLLLAALPHDAGDIRDPDVFLLDAEADQQIETGQRRRAGTRTDELHRGEIFANDAQSVDYRRPDDDRGAMLIVVKHRDPHPLATLALDVKAFRRFDVLEIDPAKRGFKRADDLDQLLRIALVDLDVEAIDTGEFLEQHRLAFHDRLAGQGTDRAQAEHGGAVGDDADQIAAGSEVARLGGVADDFIARRGDAGRVRECEIPLIGELLGG